MGLVISGIPASTIGREYLSQNVLDVMVQGPGRIVGSEL